MHGFSAFELERHDSALVDSALVDGASQLSVSTAATAAATVLLRLPLLAHGQPLPHQLSHRG